VFIDVIKKLLKLGKNPIYLVRSESSSEVVVLKVSDTEEDKDKTDKKLKVF
jgi:hypothetical protein